MKPAERADALLDLSPGERRAELERMSHRQRRSLRPYWRLWAHEGQVAPGGAWQSWMIMAGRGYGKTRAGAEWVRETAEADPSARIALVGASLGEARRVMVEGPSGVLAVSPSRKRPVFEPSRQRLVWPTGAQAFLYSAADPESLRGPQHSHAWCDELAKWEQSGGRAEACWDNLQLGLRVGQSPRALVTTTPRAVALVRRLVADAGVAVTRGATEDNARNISTAFVATIRRRYGGTALGRQELDGELLTDVEGALWSRSLIERCREEGAAVEHKRVVVGVDPPASARGDACGIVVCALGEDGVARVLADCSVEKAGPDRWSRAVAEAAAAWSADRVVVEANQGGAMVESVLRAADISLPLKLVHASRGKTARAEPVMTLYENGRARHAGMFARLEDQMCGMMTAGGYEGPGRSPDRADALVWALTELMLGKRVAEPRVRVVI